MDGVETARHSTLPIRLQSGFTFLGLGGSGEDPLPPNKSRHCLVKTRSSEQRKTARNMIIGALRLAHLLGQVIVVERLQLSLVRGDEAHLQVGHSLRPPG